MTEPEDNSTPAKAARSVERLAYDAPALLELGTLADLTHGFPSGGFDDFKVDGSTE